MKIKKSQIPFLCNHLKNHLPPQATILLIGKLGAGKTTFTRCLLREYGYEGPVRSPTYTLMTLYPTTPPILHADLYRLNQFEEVGLEDHLNRDLCIIEWPEKNPTLIDDSQNWKIYFEVFDETTRIVRVLPPQGVLYTEPVL